MKLFEAISELVDQRFSAMHRIGIWQADTIEEMLDLDGPAVDSSADRLLEALRAGELIASRNGVPLPYAELAPLDAKKLWMDRADPLELEDRAVWEWLPHYLAFPFSDTPLLFAGAWIADQAGAFIQMDVKVDASQLFFRGRSITPLNCAPPEQASEGWRRRTRDAINELLCNLLLTGEFVLYGSDPTSPSTKLATAIPREMLGSPDIQWWRDYAFVAGRHLHKPTIRRATTAPVVDAKLSEWMIARAAAFFEEHGSPIKRDTALKECCAANQCKSRQALAAWNSVPARYKRPSRQRRA
jgi:hypothetical protein